MAGKLVWNPVPSDRKNLHVKGWTQKNVVIKYRVIVFKMTAQITQSQQDKIIQKVVMEPRN